MISIQPRSGYFAAISSRALKRSADEALVFGFQSTNISPRLCTGRLPCRLPGSIAAESCEYEDRPAEVLGVPGKCLQRPKHADVTRFGERPARQMMFFEDRAD